MICHQCPIETGCATKMNLYLGISWIFGIFGCVYWAAFGSSGGTCPTCTVLEKWSKEILPTSGTCAPSQPAAGLLGIISSLFGQCVCRTMVTMAYNFTQMLKPSHLSAGNHNLTHAYLVKHFFNLQICQSRILFTASDPRPSGTPYQREGISAKMWYNPSNNATYVDIDM